MLVGSFIAGLVERMSVSSSTDTFHGAMCLPVMGKTREVAKSAEKADRKLSRHVASHRDNKTVQGARSVAELADQPPLITLCVVTIVAGAALRRPAVARTGVRMLASHLLATGLKTMVKRSVDRTRPAKAIDSGTHAFRRGKSHDHDQSSFPSGHTAGAVAIAAAIAHDAPAVALPLYATSAAVAAAQLPSGKHYLIDTLAGAAIGYVSAKAAGAALRVAEARLAALRRRSAINFINAERIDPVRSEPA